MRCMTLALLLVGCADRADAPPVKRDLEAPITCDRDRDCPQLACGPCKSGEVIREKVRHTNCGSNPCPGVATVCTAGTCRVK
jgi:hypothetical protein